MDNHNNGGMGKRGVTRPMAMHGKGDGKMEHGEPYSDARYKMLRMHHKQTLWVYWCLIGLGVWMLAAPFSLGYLNPMNWVDPSGGRGVWFGDGLHTELRAWLMTANDLLAGVLLIFFGWRALKPDRPMSLWGACFVGAAINVAPVLFWAPTSAAYLNNTLVGMLVIALTILIPGMPNMILFMKMGGEVPQGWSYNPSSWPQRWIMILLGFAGLLVSRYLGMFQLGYIETAWDPFFGGSTEAVLNSNMSHMWPVSDGALGGLAYTFEFLMGFMGAPTRWRTMPWMVAFFGILVIPLGLVHIFLVISQPVVVGQWCTMCLLAAAIMLPMIPIEVDEVIAMGQHMVRAKKRGEGMWNVFWKGGNPEGSTEDERSPELMQLPEKPGAVLKSSVWGMSVPWTLAVSAVIGIGLMAVPDLLSVEKPASIVYHLGGALIVVLSVICMGEPLRLGRYGNLLLGLVVAALPWFLSGGGVAAHVIGLVAGLVVIILAFPRGPKQEQYGLWESYVR